MKQETRAKEFYGSIGKGFAYTLMVLATALSVGLTAIFILKPLQLDLDKSALGAAIAVCAFVAPIVVFLFIPRLLGYPEPFPDFLEDKFRDFTDKKCESAHAQWKSKCASLFETTFTNLSEREMALQLLDTMEEAQFVFELDDPKAIHALVCIHVSFPRKKQI